MSESTVGSIPLFVHDDDDDDDVCLFGLLYRTEPKNILGHECFSFRKQIPQYNWFPFIAARCNQHETKTYMIQRTPRFRNQQLTWTRKALTSCHHTYYHWSVEHVWRNQFQSGEDDPICLSYFVLNRRPEPICSDLGQSQQITFGPRICSSFILMTHFS